jgi:hypothetical protein
MSNGKDIEGVGKEERIQNDAVINRGLLIIESNCY